MSVEFVPETFLCLHLLEKYADQHQQLKERRRLFAYSLFSWRPSAWGKKEREKESGRMGMNQCEKMYWSFSLSLFPTQEDLILFSPFESQN